MDRIAQETIEKDIDFDVAFNLIRVVNRREATDLLHSMLRIAFNNGEAFGMNSMAKIADGTLAAFSSEDATK